MCSREIRLITVFCLIAILLLPVMAADTWQLEKGANFRPVSDDPNGKYLLAVSEIKRLVDTGRAKEAESAIKKLKKDFPEITGTDFDAYMAAEILFAKGKFTKASGSYEKFLNDFPESELYEAALQRQFEIATAYLAGRKIRVLGVFKIKGYASGEKIMDRIIDRAGDAPIAVKAAVAVAENLEKRKKFESAYQRWSDISSKWPTGQVAEDSLLAMARCKQAAYRGPQYNAAGLISARSYYENFKTRYPEDAKTLKIDDRIAMIDEQLAYKQFCTGQFYSRIGQTLPANLYYRMVIDNWPGSAAAKMAKDSLNISGKR